MLPLDLYRLSHRYGQPFVNVYCEILTNKENKTMSKPIGKSNLNELGNYQTESGKKAIILGFTQSEGKNLRPVGYIEGKHTAIDWDVDGFALDGNTIVAKWVEKVSKINPHDLRIGDKFTIGVNTRTGDRSWTGDLLQVTGLNENLVQCKITDKGFFTGNEIRIIKAEHVFFTKETLYPST